VVADLSPPDRSFGQVLHDIGSKLQSPLDFTRRYEEGWEGADYAVQIL
jgi:hypothetical protein